jgi:hypothetical protein
MPEAPKQASSGPRKADAATYSTLTRADVRKIGGAARRSRYTREVAAGGRVRVGKVIPSISAGGRTLLGGVAYVYLSPPVTFDDQILPGTISPDHKAPPGTPTLYRYGRVSASNVSELEEEIRMPSGRAVRIEPAGDGYRVTKEELIGPAPTNPAYAPEPGY